MKKLNELVATINSETKCESYIKLVFDLLMVFLKDFGLGVIEEYFPQITNKHSGEFFRTCWYQKHSGIDRETFDYDNINVIDGRLVGHLKLGHMLDLTSSNCRFYVSISDIGNLEIENAFKKEWQELFRNEKNNFEDMIVLRLNQGVYNTLLKSKPQLKDVEGFGNIKEFMETEYAYAPSKEVLDEADKILEKLRA